MNGIRGILALFFVFSIIIILFDWGLIGEAPHPGGGTTTIDFTNMFGRIGKAISGVVFYAWITLCASFVCLVLTSTWIRRFLPF